MPATARFSVDVGAPPFRQDLRGLRTDQQAHIYVVCVDFEPDDVPAATFTATRAGSADVIQKFIGDGLTTPGCSITPIGTSGTVYLLHFLLDFPDLLLLLSEFRYAISVHVTRDGETIERPVQDGVISAQRGSATFGVSAVTVTLPQLVTQALAAQQFIVSSVGITTGPTSIGAVVGQAFSGASAVVLGGHTTAATARQYSFQYAPGDSLASATFARATTAWSQDVNGVWQQSAINTARDAHYIGGVRHLLLEPQRTNVALWCRDLTNAAWTKTSVTATKDQAGIDGTATSATRLTATGAGGTCLQGITLGSSARYQSAFVKRITGSGTVQMTMDNGATWTTVTVTGSWARYLIPTQTLANPTIGFLIATSGDEIAVDFVQNEDTTFGSTVSSPILTNSAAVTRGADSLYVPYAFPPTDATAYLKTTAIGATAGRQLYVGNSTETGNQWLVAFTSGGTFRTSHSDGAAQVNSIATITPTLGDTIEKRSTLFADGSVQIGYAINLAAETNATQSAAKTLPGAWGDTKLWLGGTPPAPGFVAIRRVIVTRGAATLADMRNF